MYQSMMTFIYTRDLETMIDFVEEALGLEVVYQPDWARVYRVTGSSYLGLVDQTKGSLSSQYKGGCLISLTVEALEDSYKRIEAFGVDGLTPIRAFEDIGVKSFFFKGPGGYDFEIQSFYKEDIRVLFD